MGETATESKRGRCRTSIAERAREVGVNRSTMYRWIQDGIGPEAIEVGNRVFITDDEWAAWKKKRSARLS